MARTAHNGLSQHATKGFRICIGKTADGKYRTFWLGHDRAVAEYGATMYRRQHAQQIKEGRTHWLPAEEAHIKSMIEKFKATVMQLPAQWNQEHAERMDNWQQAFGQPAPVKADATTAEPTTPTLHAAVDAFNAAFSGKAISDSHKERTRQLLEELKLYRKDIPLKDIDRVWLQELADFIKGRPMARRRKSRLSPYTVRNLLKAWGRFIDWLDANADSPRFGHWQAPRRWQELFKVQITKLMSKAERDIHADGPKQLTVAQVANLYGHCKNDTHRITVLLGIFAALGQREIASLRRDEFDLDAGILTHRRSKTGQRGQFWLPPELVTLVRTYFSKTATDKANTAFFTSDGSLLVTKTSDAIRQAWTDIVDRVNKGDGISIEKGKQGFYHLRKFTADYAVKNGGRELRDALLAHAPQSMGDKHYSNARNFAGVADLGRKLHAELTAAGMFKAD